MHFANRIIRWQKQHGRHHLPWQCNDPYRIWLSEIMLQQTQVNTVIPYYQTFLKIFPDINTLANAEQDEVLALWSGLGYYARARNLHQAARQICSEFAGEFPRSREELETLKGVGRSTAAAIAVFAYSHREAILDGNVKRILARHRTIAGDLTTRKNQRILWQLAENLLPTENIKFYTQGIMDLGSIICTRSKPNCTDCPIRKDCLAYQAGKTTDFPEKKRKQVKPEKTGYFLLCRCNNSILLHKRPEKGIWGNLWVLPWFENKEALENFADTYQLENSHKHTTLTHQFTHYTLHLDCHHYQSLIAKKINDDNFSPFQWFSLLELSKIGIPTAIKKILANRYSHKNNF